MSAHPLPVIVSIATLPSRIGQLRSTLDSLLNGELVPDRILVLYSEYSEREKSAYIIPDFLIDEEYCRDIIELRVTRDLGPGTKILGALEYLKVDCYLVLADDDVSYHRRFLVGIVEAQASRPDCSFSYYTYRAGGLTLGQGCDGFSFYSPNLRGIRDFAEKYVVGTTVMYHDDLWISFFLFAKGIKVKTVPTSVHGEMVYTQIIPNEGLSSLTSGELARDRIVNDSLPRLVIQSNLDFSKRLILTYHQIYDWILHCLFRLSVRLKRMSMGVETR